MRNFQKFALLLLRKRERVVSADMRFERVASTSGVRTHRKNERFSFAADTPILIFELKILPEIFRKVLAFIRFYDYNYTVNL